jgi:Tripartite tricarboxylate transporter family receptor
MGGKGNNGFHAILEVPKGDKHPHPRFAQLPEIESFAKTEKEKKLLAMWRGFRTAASPFVLPPGTPKDQVEILQEAMRKVFNDPEFRAEFKKLVTDDVSPLMPEELMKVIKETPRDAEVIEMLKRFSGGNRFRHAEKAYKKIASKSSLLGSGGVISIPLRTKDEGCN